MKDTDDPLEITVQNGDPPEPPEPKVVLMRYRMWLVEQVEKAKLEWLKDKQRDSKGFLKMWEDRYDRFTEALQKLDKMLAGDFSD